MCGIAGLWLSGGVHFAGAEDAVDGMLSCILHRGPDDGGLWTDRDAGVVLGHRRLSIIDLSPLGHQPMLAGDNRFAIVFNGEIYNYQELRAELTRKGIQFSSTSDTEVLLAGYRAWGTGVVDRLVGMFSFAIWDAKSRDLFLARDRAGEKPLCYAHGAWGFAFASEISALAQLPFVADDIDQEAVALYLQYQYVPSPRTIYRAVKKLPPGHAMRVAGGSVTTWRYWDPTPLAVGPRLDIDEVDAANELESRLRTAVRGQMIADVPLGAFLSGGVDSTAVVSLMVELSSSPVRTFTIGFRVPQFDESEHAHAVAQHLGTAHTVEYLTERDALDLIPRVAEMYGEPFADPSALPTHLLSVTARKQVTVSLSGDGGDEVLGGYSRYDKLEDLTLLGRSLGASGSRLLTRMPGRVGRVARLLTLPQDAMYRRLVGVLEADDVRALTGCLPVLPEFERAWAASAGQPVRQRAMLADLLTYLPEAILVKVDRAAMATSLETRAPILDHRVIEFALQLPVEFVRRKRLLKQLVYRRVPRRLMDRPKQGFGVPLSRWFRGELRPLLLDVLTPSRTADLGLRDYGTVRRLLDEHLSGARDQSARLWPLLVLGLWHDAHRVRARARAPVGTGAGVVGDALRTGASVVE